MRVKYIRVSTEEQNTERQHEDSLKMYIDKISGTVAFEDRPAASKLLKDIEEGKVTEIEVHSIDRLGRSAIDILNTIKSLTAKGINLISKKEGIQTMENGKESPFINAMIGVMSTFAELEYNIRKERQREGVQIAKAKGRYKGRASTKQEYSYDKLMTKKANKDAIKYLLQGESLRRAAKLSGISLTYVQRLKKVAIENGVKGLV